MLVELCQVVVRGDVGPVVTGTRTFVELILHVHETTAVKSRKFCTFLHVRLSSDEHHQRLLSKRRTQFRHVEILSAALPFFALLDTERRHQS